MITRSTAALATSRSDAILTRRAPLAPTSADSTTRTVRATISTGAGVERRDIRGPYIERLDIAAIHPETLVGLPVLDAHGQSSLGSLVGVIDAAGRDSAGIWADLRISERAAPFWNDIVAGIIRGVSVGYGVSMWRETSENGRRTKTAVAWSIREVSLVPVPADPGATIRSTGTMEPENDVIDAPAAEPTITETRAAIRGIARAAALPTTWADQQIDAEATVIEARAAAFEEMQTRSRRTPAIRTVAPAEDRSLRIRALEDALAVRMTGALPADAARADAARPFVGHSLRDFAREALTMRGVSTSGMGTDELFRAALHTTSDFPNLLSGAGRRSLLASYEAAASPLKTLARQGGRVDFRSGSTIRLGEIGGLQRVTEAGEIKHVSRAEAAESYALDTYAALFSISRKALVNDDLGAFNDWAQAAGQAAAHTEADLLWSLLSQNAGVGPTMSDGKRLFHVDHGNVGDGTSFAETALDKGRLALRRTKGLDGKTIVNASPKYLLVGPELETAAEKLLATINPSTTDAANPFAGKLTLLVEPRIVGLTWFLFADPATAPVLEYSYLASAPGPQMSSREGWDVLSIEYRVYEDFGCGAIGWRGAFRDVAS